MNCICFPEWSVAERRKTDAARRAAAHATEIADAFFAHSLYVTGGWTFEVIPNDLGNESTGAQLVIYDETGEEVESYEIVMFGDVTGDCIIDASDCSLTLSLMVGEGEYGDFLMVDEGAHPFAADADHNGMLDASDISVILEMAVGDSEWGQTL